MMKGNIEKIFPFSGFKQKKHIAKNRLLIYNTLVKEAMDIANLKGDSK